MGHIFRKELLQSKRQMALLFLVFTFLFIILGVIIINNNKSITDLSGPDIEIYGKLSNPGEYSYYSKLDATQWKPLENEEVEVYNLVIRNIINLQDEKTLKRVDYSVIGCPMDFIENQLSQYIIKGRMPKLDSNEVLLGEKMIQFYGLAVGDVFDNTLRAKTPYEYIGLSTSIEEKIDFNDTTQWKVVGVIRSNKMQYDCSLFVPDYADKISSLNNKVNIYFPKNYPKKDYLEIRDMIVNNKDESTGYIYENYYQKVKQQEEAKLIIGVISMNIILIIYVILLYIFKSDSRKIGILNALGLRNRTIVKYYLSLFAQIEALSFSISIVTIILYIIYRNNNLVVLFEVSEAAYVLKLETIAFLFMCAIIFLVILAFVVSVKVNRCIVKQAVTKY